jgi:hypothetical protein
MAKQERKSKLEKLEAEKWRLAEAMDNAADIRSSYLCMMQLNNVGMEIYYEEMRLSGISRAKAKKELFRTLEASGFKYKDEIKAIA